MATAGKDNIKEIMEKLQEPFAPSDIEWRVQRGGSTGSKLWAMVLAYVTNRAIMERLDTVVGIDNWRNEYQQAPDGGVMCGLSIRLNSEWITKWDGAENTQVEAVKGGLSGAMKRAAVQWGIGRYLYKLEDNWAQFGDYKGKTNSQGQPAQQYYDKESKTRGHWLPPLLPDFAVPENFKNKKDEEK